MDVYKAWEDYTTKVIKLMIWHIWYLVNRDTIDLPISKMLDLRVDILRKTTVYDGRHPALGLNPPITEWDKLKTQLESKILAHRNASNTHKLEQDCWKILAPFVEPKLEDGAQKSEELPNNPYDCWRYNIKDKTYIDIHFANAYRPESPFDAKNKQKLASTLYQLLIDALRENPAVSHMQCGSWLNDFPPFQSMFPKTWNASYKAVYDYYATAGWWGQYMDHRGAFHAQNAEQFRHTGTHPYTSGTSHCLITEAIAHLEMAL